VKRGGQSEEVLQAPVAFCWHCLGVQQKQVPPALQIEGAIEQTPASGGQSGSGPGGCGMALHGVLTASPGTFVGEALQSHDWPMPTQAKPSPQSESWLQLTFHIGSHSVAGAHDWPPSAMTRHSVAAPC
jgi:hypothetical protein